MRVRFAHSALVTVVMLAGAAAGSAAEAPTVTDKVTEQKIQDLAPRATQIEPVVAPVKRVAPQIPKIQTPKNKTPEVKTLKIKTPESKSAKSKAAVKPKHDATHKSAANKKPSLAKVSKARDEGCAKGFKLDDTGSKCVKLTGSATKTVQKTARKK